MTKCNMKIPVENNLDEIVGELERIGFIAWCVDPIDNGFAITNKKGLYTTSYKDLWDKETLTTLSELKEMQ